MARAQDRTLTTEELLARREDPTTVVVDVRSPDAYNGWSLRGEDRGGHVPGARSLPAKWADYLDWIEIVRAKGIEPDAPIVLYGDASDDLDRVARRLAGSGYGNVAVYHDLLKAWIPDPALPLDRLARWEHLVPSAWLAERIGNGGHEDPAHDLVLLHTHYRNPADYEKGHIPGALSLDTNRLESTETWSRRSPTEIERVLRELGVRADTTVVVYGRCSHPRPEDPFPGSSAGHIAAFRCALILLHAGVEDVRILNGGLQSWLDDGHELSQEPSSPHPVADFGRRIPGHPEVIVDLPEAKRILASPDANLVSVRSWPEFIGEVSGYDYIEKKGRIPGAVFGNCGSDAYHMENYRNLDQTTREYGEVEANWARAGITPDKQNAFYCGTGWRGSEAFFNAWLMGWPRVAVFDGGWFEWSQDENNPCETGVPAEFV